MAESNAKAVDPTGFVVAVAVLVVLGPLVGAEYVWDDDALIVQNAALDGGRVLAALAGGLWEHTAQAQVPGIYYRPCMLWSLHLDRALGGGPLWAHLHSLVWHLVNVCLVAVVARRLGLRSQSAWLGAALFGLHPVAVESVAWVSARNDPMAVAAILGAMALSLQHLSARGMVVLGIVVAFGAGAKETAYLTPLILIPVLVAEGRATRRPVAVAVVAVSVVVLGRWCAGVGWPEGADWAHLRASALPTITWALDSLAVPGVRAPGAHLAWPEPVSWIGVPAAVTGVGWVAFAGRRRALGFLLGGILAAVPAWPAVAHVGLFGDRYLLLPLAMGALAVSAAVDRLPLERLPVKGLLLVLALPSMLLTAASVPAWRSDLDLWQSAVDHHENPHTAGSLAKVLELEGDLDGAARWYAVATAPPRPLEHACWNVAALEVKRGAPAQAAEVGLRALAGGCKRDAELVCPTAFGLAWSARWDEAEPLLTAVPSDPTGLCTITGLAFAARARNQSVLDEATGGDPRRRADLSRRLGALLRAGQDTDSGVWVESWAEKTPGVSDG